jgi:DNA repair exonuclease SbcCD nuclease subunit
MLIALLNDTHCGVRNSADIFLNYYEYFYRDVFFPYCKEHKINHILHLGDYYDNRKTINLKALYHNRKTFLEPMCAAGMTMDIIPGNHDVSYKNTNALCSLKELLGHFMNNVTIIMSPKTMNYGGVDIALLPWLNEENYDESIQFLNSTPAKILAGHLELAGFDIMPGVKSHGGMNAEMFAKFDSVWSGHFHTKSKRGNIHYLGTQFEITWSDCNDPKYFHVFDTETGVLTEVRNPYVLFKKIFYDDSRKQTFDFPSLTDKFVRIIVTGRKNKVMFDTFIDNVARSNPFEYKIVENYDAFTGEAVSINEDDLVTDTTELIGQYIDGTETTLDKDILKTRLRELYTEALNYEVV